jgi:hypothetical protein
VFLKKTILRGKDEKCQQVNRRIEGEMKGETEKGR